MEKNARVKTLIAASAGLFTEADQKMLETADDARLTGYEAKFKAANDAAAEKATADAAAKVASDKVIADKAAADALAAAPAVAGAAKAPTFAELLATADPATRAAIEEGKRVGEAKKAASIAVLKGSKRCDLTDLELNAMTQSGLDALVKLADVKVAVDFSGQGAPRRSEETTAVEAPPDMVAAVRAKHATAAA